MSLEASAYIADETPIPRDDLVRAAADAGWVLRPVTDPFDPTTFGAVGGGVLADGDYFYGWRADDPHAGEYEEALARRDVKRLERWAQEDPDRNLGAAFISMQPYEYDSTDEFEPPEDIEAQFAAMLQRAKLEYLIELHSENDEFLLDLARLVCRLRGGGWVDHLGGECGIESPA